MATYAIGDLQGCLTPLLKLLDIIQYNPDQDQLWFAGDLINRGPESLATLRFIYSLRDKVKVVLGNHDLHLLALSRGFGRLKRSDTLKEILNAPDRDQLLDWLQSQPLCHFDKELNTVMVHAGIPPCWNLEQALQHSKEVESTLKSDHADDFFSIMYGNKSHKWDDSLTGMERLRVIVNYLTRMRFCTDSGRLDLKSKEGPSTALANYAPWFSYPSKLPQDCQVVFGHWAALEGKVNYPNIHALDTGCVWGGSLTAIRLDDRLLFSTPCPL
ncbi:symmetrical bis(5'-nucleosyl)-tetraphosphatase [Marinomonas sp. 2405UD68-3]|uniref:symmetrical bis(5'-nucleosyl)-tetraphosphatase n=1 Tax=Marinomonas sp. 2405UD68-3 TaxID=3391835 RepID=UPI0039C9D2BB